MDEFREGLVRAIKSEEDGIARRQTRLKYLRVELNKYDAQGFEVFECRGEFPREAVPRLLRYLGREATAGEIIARLLDGGVKVGSGRPEVNVRIALTILVKSGRLWVNGEEGGAGVMVKDEDVLSFPVVENAPPSPPTP